MDNSIASHNNRAFLSNAQLDENNIRSSFRASSSPPANLIMTSLPELVLTCVSCNEPCAPQSFVAACEHAYCNVCITSYVESGLQPIGVFPPQCCSVPITLQLSRTHLTPQIIERYEAKQAEIAAVMLVALCRTRLPHHHPKGENH